MGRGLEGLTNVLSFSIYFYFKQIKLQNFSFTWLNEKYINTASILCTLVLLLYCRNRSAFYFRKKNNEEEMRHQPDLILKKILKRLRKMIQFIYRKQNKKINNFPHADIYIYRKINTFKNG